MMCLAVSNSRGIRSSKIVPAPNVPDLGYMDLGEEAWATRRVHDDSMKLALDDQLFAQHTPVIKEEISWKHRGVQEQISSEPEFDEALVPDHVGRLRGFYATLNSEQD